MLEINFQNTVTRVADKQSSGRMAFEDTSRFDIKKKKTTGHDLLFQL
jgi:hypothetical protein